MVIPIKNLINTFLATVLGFSSGVVIAGAVFAFISIIGIVPRLAEKTKTENNIKWYETMIIIGGIWGSTAEIFNYRFPIGVVLTIVWCFSTGIFIGCLAMSLAEILNVLPILFRRVGLQRGLSWFVISIAVGKLVGSLAYLMIPGFYEP